MMSRSRMRPSIRDSRQNSSALMVSGLTQMPPIIFSRPASMRLAMAISPSRESSSTEPISRRYMRTGSSVRPMSSSAMLPAVGPFSASSGALSSGSSLSITEMPISESIDMVSSICSEDIWSGGSTLFSSS